MRAVSNRLFETYMALARETFGRRPWEKEILAADATAAGRRAAELVNGLAAAGCDVELYLAASISADHFVAQLEAQIGDRPAAEELTRAAIELAGLLEDQAGPVARATGFDDARRAAVVEALQGFAAVQVEVFTYVRATIDVTCDPGEAILLVPLAPIDRPAGVVRAGDGRAIPYVDMSRFRGLDLYEAACTELVAANACDDERSETPFPWSEVARRVGTTVEDTAALQHSLRTLLHQRVHR
jgi:hypothetical protein